MCRQYYAALHGVAANVVKKAVSLARSNAHAPKERAPIIAPEQPKYQRAYAFWAIFFENHCQRPNDTDRIFPSEKTFEQIESQYFKPWFKRAYAREIQGMSPEALEGYMPSFTTWKRARYDANFKDVKAAKKHTHGRCQTCAELKELLLESFVCGKAEREYQQRRRMHDEEVIRWRKLEEIIKARVADNPEEEILIIHDGTVKTGLPRITRRTIKNLNPARFDVVPWLASDHGAARNDYIYTPNASTSKDTNYLISHFHAVIRRAKSDYDHPRHRARKLTVIADSASENKNNILLAYYTDMVVNGWFDSVELLFGPVGHTHNGVAATHKIHNVDVGQCVSGDLGHYVKNYSKGFSGRSSMKLPSASILSRIADWKAYYTPVLRKIAGFTKTTSDPLIVRGFRIAKQRDGSVDVRWKADPGNEREWRGVGGFPNEAGFHLRMAAPNGLPKFVPPSSVLQTDAHAKHGDILGKPDGLAKALRPQGLEACAEWCKKAHQEGKIPVYQYVEETTPPGEWGRLCEVGAVPGKRGLLREITDFWDGSLPDEHATLWHLPVCPRGSHSAATTNKFHYSRDAAILSSARIPLVRYADRSAQNSEVAGHPNNVVGGGWVNEDGAIDGADNANGVAGEDNTANVGGEAEAEPGAGAAEAAGDQEPLRRYEEPIAGCKKDEFAVGMAETNEGPSPYIFVGKIVETQLGAKPYPTFTMIHYIPTKDSWSEQCLTSACKWNRHKKETVTQPHYSVMKYFNRLNRDGSLPAAIRKAVEERKINWCASASESSDSSD